MNRNDKNKKFTALNINNVFKGKPNDAQNKSSIRVAGMQNIGKVSSMRRVPAPKWTPSIKAETGASENKQIINQTSSGWVNSTGQETADPNMLRNQYLVNKDKNQWTTKASSNKPFFLMGQEFPSLQSDVGMDTNIDSNKDNSKLKESDSVKSKLDELRNRDNSISVSTLNRIDALSISKSSKGDIAATGWAAEDEEPNFDEKLVFSDEESLNEVHNWHSDVDDVVGKTDNDNLRISQQESQQRSKQFSLEDKWYEQSQRTTPSQPHYPQFQSQFQMQMTMPTNHQFMAPNVGQFSHQGLLNRSSATAIAAPLPNSINDEQVAFLNSVAEQRNARNMEYFIAIERARQKKMGGAGVNRAYGPFGEDVVQSDQSMGRSRHTSMTSDTTDCCNNVLPMMVEMGPPGGPPLIHGGSHLHYSRPHISPMMPSVSSPSSSTMIRFTQPPSLQQSVAAMSQPQFVMPIQAVSLEQITDPKLMEKWLEFLKQQSNTSDETNIYDTQMTVEQQRPVIESGLCRTMEDSHITRQVSSRPVEVRCVPVDDGGGDVGGHEAERLATTTQLPAEHNLFTADNDRDSATDRKLDTTQKDNAYKTKSLYSTDDECQRIDSSKRYNRGKYGASKEYRSSKHISKAEYSGNISQEYKDPYIGGDDEVAYEDYHVYQQHYPAERHIRDYKNVQDYRRNQTYQYYDDSYSRDPNDYNYKSSTLKYKSTKSKDYNKTSGGQIDCSQSDRGHSSTTKKSSGDNQEFQHSDRDTFDGLERKGGKEVRRSAKTESSSYTNKRYDSRPYKDRPSEPPRQEFSMGFAVNPKETRRNNYYQSNYNRHYYGPDYQYYNNYPSTNNGSDYQQYSTDYSDTYYQTDQYSYCQYEQDSAYPPSSNKNTKRPAKVGSATTSEQWRSTRSDKVKPNRNKNDKRQSSMTKECPNDNDQEEWATASEGGSDRSISAQRDGFKSTVTRHQTAPTDEQLDNEESSGKIGQNSSTENQRATETRFGSSNSCNGTWPSYPDEDGSDGASGSAGGARTTATRSNISQNKSTDSTQTTNTNDSSSKDGSNNNNSDKEFPRPVERQNRTFADFIDTNKLSSVINVDKLPEVTEDEELLYENVEQFQEVLSKATKKSRKLEEQRRLREEMEQKRLEALKLKNKNDSKIIKKPVFKKEQPQQKVEKSDSYVSRKIDNKPVTIGRDKDTIICNNNFKKYECNKVSMHIGSWDNSLADEINTERKIPPKPIGTPASTSSWNVKVKMLPKRNPTTVVNATVVRGTTEIVKENIKPQIEVKNSQTTKNIYLASAENSDANYGSSIAYSYKNPLFDRVNEDKKIKDQLESKSTEINLPGSITFDYDVKNIACDNKQKRNPLGPDRGLQNNDQQLLNDKINLVKTIWDNQPNSVTTTETEVNRTVTSNANVDLDCHTTIQTNIQDTIVSRNVVDSTPALSITNVCKVKPQLQQDFNKKDPIEPLLSSSAFAFRNSPAAFLGQNQGNFIPYTHRFPPELLQDHASDVLASLFSSNQQGMHINYNLPNPHHLLDSTLLRQNAQDHMLTNKMNFISQQSFYPQAAVTPKLFSNAGGQLPLNMDINSSHGALPLQQLLLTRQNSLTSMMQPNGMSIPFMQSGQQHAQTSLFPATPILGPSNFTSPLLQGHLPAHYSPSNFSSLHQNQQFQQNHQMLLNQQQQQQQQQQHHQHQQLLQSQISHDRVINSGQAGIFNSILGSSDISANTCLPDFNGQTKHLNHNNIMHGMNGSAIMLPHNLNILMKPQFFANSSQYNTLQAPIQSTYANVRNNYDNHSNMKLATEFDIYKSSDNNVIDRNTYCIDNYVSIPKQREDFYIDQSEYDNCDITTDNWTNNLRPTNTNNFLQTLDFQSQRSPIQFPVLDPNIAFNDTAYRYPFNNLRDNYQTMPTNIHNNSNYGSCYRNKQQFHPDQAYCNTVKQTYRNYDCPANFVIADHTFTNKNEIIDRKKISLQTTCDTTVPSESSDNFGKDIVNSEKSFSGKKKNSKQRSSFSDNFEDKNQSWSIVDENNLDDVKLKSNSNLETGNIDSGNSHSPSKQYNQASAPSRPNLFDNQCQYGYDETQLSSQTAESLGKFDSNQLKKMIMKLREGPVMTFADFDNFEVSCSNTSHVSTRKTAIVPRLVTQLQSSRNRPLHKSYNNNHSSDVHGSEFVGMGFYSRNRALTPPPPSTTATGISSTQLRNYKNGRGSRYDNSSTGSSSSQNHCPSMSAAAGTNYRSSCHSSSDRANIATIATIISVVTDSLATAASSSSIISDKTEDNGDGDYHHYHKQDQLAQQSDQLECDNNNLMIVDNIIDSPVL